MTEEEISALKNLVEQYLVFAEGQAMRRIPMNMQDWIIKLDGFLTLNDREILNHAGKVKAEIAKQIAEEQYEIYKQKRIQAEDSQEDDFDKATRQIETSKKPKKD